MNQSRGFTLIELIAVICILGVLATISVGVLKFPIQSYLDSTQRAEMDYINFDAKTPFLRELRQALPSSVRLSGTQWLEFVPMRWSGRYRAQTCDVTPICTATKIGDKLDTTVADSSFDAYAPLASLSATSGDFVTINSGAGVYSGTSRAQITSLVAGDYPLQDTNIVLSAATLFSGSPSNRFHVVTQPVSYGCSAGVDAEGNGTGQLWRYSGYGFIATQPTTATGTASLLADQLSVCRFTQNGSLVEMQLAVSSGGEVRTLQAVARIPAEW